MGIASELRPYRKGGIRHEIEIIGDKKIIHNYGHGGAGLSLSYGSCRVSVMKLNKDFIEPMN